MTLSEVRTHPDAVTYDHAKLLAEVLAAFRAPSYVPPFTPAVAMELLALARRPEVKLTDITRVCEKDPLVAARVLSLAQSAQFARGARVRSLNDAIVRIGVRTLGQLFLEQTMTTRIFRAPGFDAAMSSLRRHSAMTGHVASLLATPGSPNAELASIKGLLHDVGVAAAAYVIGPRVPFAVAWPVILAAHAEAGQIVCRAWKLPAEIEVMVAYHHGARVGGSLNPGACVVAVAEWIASEVGFGLDGEVSERPETAMRLLGIDEAAVKAARFAATAAAARFG